MAGGTVTEQEHTKGGTPASSVQPGQEAGPLDRTTFQINSRADLLDQLPGNSPTEARHSELQRREAIENAVIFDARGDLRDVQPTVRAAAGSAATSVDRHRAEHQQQTTFSELSTSKKKRQVGSIDPAIEFIVRQLESIVPPHVLDEIVHELETKSADKSGTQLSGIEIKSIAEKLSNSLEGQRAPVALHNGELSVGDVVFHLLSPGDTQSPAYTALVEQVADYWDTPSSSRATVLLSSEEREARRAAIVAEADSIDRFIMERCRADDFCTLRQYAESGILRTDEVLAIVYGEARDLAETRGTLKAHIEEELDSTQREELAQVSGRIERIESELGNLFSATDLGREVHALLHRAEFEKQMSGILEQVDIRARAAGLHEGLATERSRETALAVYLTAQRPFLTEHPSLARLVEAHGEAARVRGQEYRKDLERTTLLLQEVLKRAGREHEIAGILASVDRQGIDVVRDLYQRRCGEHVRDSLTKRCGERSEVERHYHATYERRYAGVLPAREEFRGILDAEAPRAALDRDVGSARYTALRAETLRTRVAEAVSQRSGEELRTALLSDGNTIEGYLRGECARGGFYRVRALVEGGAVTSGEALTALYSAMCASHAERGSILGDADLLSRDVDQQSRLDLINGNITTAHQVFDDLLTNTARGLEMSADWARIESMARTEMLLNRVGQLAREAELYRGLKPAAGRERSLREILDNQQGNFLSANPGIGELIQEHMKVVRTSAAEERVKLEGRYKELRSALDEANPENPVCTLLNTLDRTELEVMRELHQSRHGSHLRDLLREHCGESGAVDAAYGAAYQRRFSPPPVGGGDLIDAVGGGILHSEASVFAAGAGVQMAPRLSHDQLVETITAGLLDQHRRMGETAADALEEARRGNFEPLIQLRGESSLEEWSAFEEAYALAYGESLALGIALLPQKEMAHLIERDCGAIMLARTLHNELQQRNRTAIESFTIFSRLHDGRDVRRALDAYRVLYSTSVLEEMVSLAATRVDASTSARIAAVTEAHLSSSEISLSKELVALSRLESSSVDSREQAAITTGDTLSVAAFAIDRALQSADPLGNIYALTGGVDPSLIEGLPERYQLLFGRAMPIAEEVVLQRAQAAYQEAVERQRRAAGGTERNRENMVSDYEAASLDRWYNYLAPQTMVFQPNFWRNLSGERKELRDAANAFEREGDRQQAYAELMGNRLAQSRAMGELALEELEHARELASSGHEAEARVARLSAHEHLRHSLAGLSNRALLIESEEMRADMERLSLGLDRSIQSLNDYERYIRTTRTVVVVGGAVIATGGLLGIVGGGAAVGGTGFAGGLGTAFTTLGGGKLAAVTLATAGVTSAGAVGNIAEQSLNVAYGNSSAGDALSRLGRQTYEDAKSAGIASTQVVVGGAAAKGVHTVLSSFGAQSSRIGVLLTSGGAGASGAVYGTAADMTLTNAVDGGQEVIRDGVIVRERFSAGDIAAQSAWNGAVGFVSGGIGGKAAVLRNAPGGSTLGRVAVNATEVVATAGVGLASAALQGDLSVDRIISEVGFAGVGTLQGEMAVRSSGETQKARETTTTPQRELSSPSSVLPANEGSSTVSASSDSLVITGDWSQFIEGGGAGLLREIGQPVPPPESLVVEAAPATSPSSESAGGSEGGGRGSPSIAESGLSAEVSSASNIAPEIAEAPAVTANTPDTQSLLSADPQRSPHTPHTTKRPNRLAIGALAALEAFTPGLAAADGFAAHLPPPNESAIRTTMPSPSAEPLVVKWGDVDVELRHNLAEVPRHLTEQSAVAVETVVQARSTPERSEHQHRQIPQERAPSPERLIHESPARPVRPHDAPGGRSGESIPITSREVAVPEGETNRPVVTHRTVAEISPTTPTATPRGTETSHQPLTASATISTETLAFAATKAGSHTTSQSHLMDVVQSEQQSEHRQVVEQQRLAEETRRTTEEEEEKRGKRRFGLWWWGGGAGVTSEVASRVEPPSRKSDEVKNEPLNLEIMADEMSHPGRLIRRKRHAFAGELVESDDDAVDPDGVERRSYKYEES